MTHVPWTVVLIAALVSPQVVDQVVVVAAVVDVNGPLDGVGRMGVEGELAGAEAQALVRAAALGLDDQHVVQRDQADAEFVQAGKRGGVGLERAGDRRRDGPAGEVRLLDLDAIDGQAMGEDHAHGLGREVGESVADEHAAALGLDVAFQPVMRIAERDALALDRDVAGDWSEWRRERGRRRWGTEKLDSTRKRLAGDGDVKTSAGQHRGLRLQSLPRRRQRGYGERLRRRGCRPRSSPAR